MDTAERKNKMIDSIAREIARRSELIMLEQNIDFMEALVSLLKTNPDLLEEFVREVSTDTG